MTYNPVPKISRLVDPAAVEAAKKPYSELSGKPTYGASPHHVISVGAGGPDHSFNLVQLTAEEHIQAHAGLISGDVLFVIIAEREEGSYDFPGLPTVEYIKSEIRKMRGRCR